MSISRWIAGPAALACLALAGPTSADDKIDVKDLPAPVLKAAKKLFPEAKIVGAAKEVEDGETLFEVEMTLEGKTIDILCEPDGEVEAIEKEIEAYDLPRAVLVAARKKFPRARIVKVEEVTTEEDHVVYELAMQKGDDDDDEFEVVFAPNGKLVEDEDDDEDDKEKKEKDDDDKGEKKEKGEKKPKD